MTAKARKTEKTGKTGKTEKTGKSRGPRASKPTSPKTPSVLERLEAREAQGVLLGLLETHPELRAEAEQAARSLLAEVSFESVADDVESALGLLDLDDLNGRAGRSSLGYTSPDEAAWELLQEALDPFLANLKRQVELGLETEAVEVCKGVMLGLYQILDRKGDPFFSLAEDFPAQAAADAVSLLVGDERKGAGRGRRARLLVDEEFLERSGPEWRRFVVQAFARG